MPNNRIIYLNLVIISAALICFEILSTRVSSLIFATNYAFIIISLAILGIGCGGIFSYYKIEIKEKFREKLSKYILFVGLSFLFFILIVVEFNVTNFVIYSILLFSPFFFAGIIYSQIYKNLSGLSFRLYAADLTGAALGSVGSIVIFDVFNAPNAILFLSLAMFFSAFTFSNVKKNKTRYTTIISGLIVIIILFAIYGKSVFIGKITIGKFDEKDFYYVYPNAASISHIVESRWSIDGRSDLVEYSNQDMVRQLFVDGAAGSPLFRFSGNIKNPDNLLYELLIHNSTSIPFFFLNNSEKNDMLVIGPGGGREVLFGLLSGVGQITGVEVNPDFVNIVKKYKDFDGGIYTDFPNVKIEVGEGRHFVKKTDKHFDLIVMALPSTKQLQNIDNLAENENYLLTVEALKDYLNILTPDGRLIFTVHNRWELVRLIITAVKAFNKIGITNEEALNHFEILEQDYEPTIVIKKNDFTTDEINHTENVIKKLPRGLPSVTYLPYHLDEAANTPVNQILKLIKSNPDGLESFINEFKYNISPCWDDSPYFYKVQRGIPSDYLWLLFGVIFFNAIIIFPPLSIIKKKMKRVDFKALLFPLIVFACIGAGFMILEISLFQKLVLYLGSPTISLSVLLGSILVGMGIGSFSGKRISPNDINKRLHLVCLLIVLSGIILFILYPIILNKLLVYSQAIRSILCFFMMVPFGFLLGIPFPSAIELLKKKRMEKFVPWMYGINGTMSVLGSIIAVILAMIAGFTPSFFVGLGLYLIIFLFLISKQFTNSPNSK
jgi:SAM-dependent methyltransferase